MCGRVYRRFLVCQQSNDYIMLFKNPFRGCMGRSLKCKIYVCMGNVVGELTGDFLSVDEAAILEISV